MSQIVVMTPEELAELCERAATVALERFIATQTGAIEDPEEWLSYAQVSALTNYCQKRVGFFVTERGIHHDSYPGNKKMQSIQRKDLHKLPRK